MRQRLIRIGWTVYQGRRQEGFGDNESNWMGKEKKERVMDIVRGHRGSGVSVSSSSWCGGDGVARVKERHGAA